VLQPVIHCGAAIHGKGFSGGALNRIQKPLHAWNLLMFSRKNQLFFPMDSNKPEGAGLCNGGHRVGKMLVTLEFSWIGGGVELGGGFVNLAG
jgi:hypothetical protein